ncbi:MAG: NHLP bacteriocin export ABC transporter permease/ATPase subunit [Chlamydiales bacterium]
MSQLKIPEHLRAVFLRGEAIVVEANTHYPLNDPTAFYWLEEEGGDLFLYSRDDKNFIPIFMVDAYPQEFFFPGPVSDDEMHHSLFFVSSRRAKLRKISFATFIQESGKDPEILVAAQPFFDKWVLNLITFFLLSKKEVKIDKYFSVGESVQAEEGNTLALARTLIPEEKGKIVWLGLQKGRGELYGESSQTFAHEQGILYPFSHSLWMTAKEALEMNTLATHDALKTPRFWDSLHDFHRRIFASAFAKRAEQLERLLFRMQAKKSREEEQYQETFFKLGSVLNKKLAVPTSYEGTPLFKACDLVGQQLKVQMLAPTTPATSIHDQVREIAFASGVYVRKIALPPSWWEEADQPIVGFYGEDHHPVALLKKKSKYYEIEDLASKTITKLTPENAKNIGEEGYVFYEGFPKKAVRFLTFVKTAFKNNNADGYIFFLIAIASGLLNLFLPFAMKELFETLTFGKDLKMLAQFTLGLLIVAFGNGLFTLTKNFALQRIGGISKNQIESSMWGRILELPASFFRRFASGDLMNKASIFQTVRQQLFGDSVKMFMDIVYCIFYLALMFFYSGVLTLFALGGIFIAFLVYTACIVIQMRLTSKSFTLGSLIQGKVVQIISGIPKIRVAGAESRFFGMWGDLFAQKKKIDIRIQYTNAIQSLVFRLFPTLMSVLLYAVAIVIFRKEVELPASAQTSTLTMAVFLGFSTAFGLFFTSSLEILETLFSLSTAVPYWKQAKFILEEPLEKRPEKVQPINLKGQIALDHVAFRYDKDSDWILRDLSLVANPGEMIGIVGPSGSGKSTIVRLLLGFEAPEQGEVLYDDQSLQDLDIRGVRKQIGVVLQNAGILAGSLYENIVGAGSYTVEEIEKALHLSGFDADLEHLPMGLNTILPMGGGTFSGGQRQRLYLARALVSTPKILILDEATSALDSKTQEFVSNNLDQIDVTRIVIAHRLSTIKHADRIYVLQNGAMVETGTFNELLAKGGLFADMLKRQQV